MIPRTARVACAASILAWVGLAAPVHAGMILLNDDKGESSGWAASWDDSLDPFVSITVEDVDIFDTGAVYIKKTAEFTQGPVNGIFPSILIQFRQISPSAVSNIVISEESVTNSTGRDWTDFHMFVTGGNDVVFDVEQTASSGGGGPIGFSVNPFTGATFAEANRRLNLDDGTVPAGGVFEPGTAGIGDDLWIRATVRETSPLTTFFLKERPTPEPATAALLSVGAALVLMRRRQTS
jgi:hypothetical protein